MVRERRARRHHERKAVFVPVRASPGKLYRSISVERAIFKGGTTKLEKPLRPRFVAFCKWCGQNFSGFGGKSPFAPKYKDALEFLGWNLKPSEFNAAITFTLFLSFVLAVGIGFLLLMVPFIPDCNAIDPLTGETTCISKTALSMLGNILGNNTMAMVYLFVPLIIVIYLVVSFVQKFPLQAAKTEEIKALTYVPEIVGYLTMSMKLVPNLEKAVEFAAQHGRGKIAEDFKKMIWDVQLGVYNTLSEALDALAYRWGKFSGEFKRSLMMVRASVLEETEAKRYALLDKTIIELLDSIKNKMEQYARDLSQPSVFLFYLGVLLPLILIIILPIGSAFSGQPLARTDLLILIYNILIPIAAWVFARNVIKRRPPTYESPIIPDSHPDLPKKWKMKLGKSLLDVRFAVILVLMAGLGASYFLSTYGVYLNEETPLIPKDRSLPTVIQERFSLNDPNYFELGGTLDQRLVQEGKTEGERKLLLAIEKQKFFSNPENDITPYNLIFGSLLTVASAIALGLYYRNIYKRKMQEETARMETEFRDSLYILASRMGENKPVEEALEHTRGFLPNTLIAERVYGKTVDNIHMLGLPLESAIFDPNFGSLKNLSSNIIQSSMKLLVDSVQLGVNVSARTLISLSLQLTNSEKVSRLLRTLVQDITSMMQTTAVFIAPIILGVTTSLQKIVIQTLLNITQETSTASVPTFASINNPALQGFNLEQLLGPTKDIIDSMVSPGMFIIIVAVYVIEIVFIMTYFNTKIQEDNDILFKINFAKVLPVAVLVFIISVIASNTLVATISG